MKKTLLSVFALSAIGFASCTSNTETNTTVNSDTAVLAPSNSTTTTTTTVTRTIYKPLDENVEYVDLRTNKKFKLKKNDMGIYTTDAGADLEYYYNPATKDTFYMGEAYPVSGHLTRNGNDWSIDRTWFETQYPNAYNPSASSTGGTASGTLPVTGEAEKVRVESDGDTKLKNNDGTIKEKLKTDGEGDDMKYKVKNKETGEKVKVTEDQIKVKDANGNKTVIEKDGDVKVK